MLRELLESELTKEIKKSEQAEKNKDADRKEGDDDKVDKDIKAQEIEKKDTEPNKPKTSVPSQAELMAQNPEQLAGEEPVDVGKEPVSEPEADEEEPEDKKKKKDMKEMFYKALDESASTLFKVKIPGNDWVKYASGIKGKELEDILIKSYGWDEEDISEWREEQPASTLLEEFPFYERYMVDVLDGGSYDAEDQTYLYDGVIDSDEVIISVPKKALKQFKELTKKISSKATIEIFTGGEEEADPITPKTKAAFKKLSDREKVVAIFNSAANTALNINDYSELKYKFNTASVYMDHPQMYIDIGKKSTSGIQMEDLPFGLTAKDLKDIAKGAKKD